ncbi:MAG: FemAB family PEP-CTERM system-associated protein [Planctomycetota bacterium]|nr:FemAB family PEP-CTERM system-associated protein [Planctomycetota bacterium]
MTIAHRQAATGVEVRPAAPADDERRDAFVIAHPDGSFFHRSAWRRVVERSFGHESRELHAWRGDELVGVLPLMLCRSVFSRRNLVSIPYAVYGGPVASDSDAEHALVETAVRLADTGRVGHLELRYRRDPGPDLIGSELYWTFVRDLPEKEEDVLASMPKKARAEARKARERHGLELSEGAWYVDDLYRFFARNKHGLGSPALPALHFQELLHQYGKDVRVHLVRRNREPLAAVMSFLDGDTLIAYYAGTDPGADGLYSASNFMYLALQEWAVRHGLKRFDFSRSRRDSGAFRFKKNQGLEPTPLHYRYHLVHGRRIPSFNPSNPRMRFLQELWIRMPSWFVRRLSNRLAAYLP